MHDYCLTTLDKLFLLRSFSDVDFIAGEHSVSNLSHVLLLTSVTHQSVTVTAPDNGELSSPQL